MSEQPDIQPARYYQTVQLTGLHIFPELTPENVEQHMRETIAEIERSLSEKLFSCGTGQIPPLPVPTRLQRFRTWAAARLLGLVFKLDAGVVPL